MSISELLWKNARSNQKKGLPVLSFPAVQKLGITVEQMVKSSELQAKAMAVIAADTDTIAAVSPMDLSIEAEAFGAQVCFHPDDVPAVVGRLISSEEEADALAVPDLSAARVPVSIGGVRLAKELISDKPVLAGMIGPFSLAGRLMDVTEIMYTCFDEPETVHKVLKKSTEFLIKYALAMKEAGADGVVMAEPLAGILNPDMAEEFSVPYVKVIVDALAGEGFEVVYHNCGSAVTKMLDSVFSQGAAAYHFGNAVDMEQILKQAPSDVLCMGNVDPSTRFANGTAQSMTAAVKELMDKCGGYQNFIPSSGCDIPAQSSWNNINAFFEALKR